MSAATVADLIAAQAARRPEAVAVVAGDLSMTAAQLDARATRLAHGLRALGVGPDVIVGIGLGRSLELAVALVGVLKAGGACLTLDPSYPATRLALMLADSKPAVVITSAELAAAVPPHPGHTVVLAVEELDDEEPDVEEPAAAVPAPGRQARADDLGYVIYTSGSTGEPKGVMLTHRGLVNHSLAVGRVFGLGPDDRVLQFCSLSFDVSIEEMLPTWVAGATVVFRPDDLPLVGRPWLDWVRTAGITVLNLPTAYWQQWGRDLQSRSEAVPDAVRLVVVGGERVPGGAYRTWMAVGGDRSRWLNGYGPAEASVTATVYEAPPPGPGGDGDPPIGRPVPPATVHILDDDGQPVAPGAVGELYVGGPGVARGYLGRPGLTAERFLPDPFAAEPGARLYRTGDRGRRRPDGNIEFAGRLDHQVKVRGFRIESGEVEAALTSHPAVAAAAVVAREEVPGDMRLVAYVVGDDPGAGSGELRRFLADRLPPYMLPSAFVRLDALPRTAGGKVDRAALPAPPRARPRLATPSVGPRTPTERTLAAIWSEVLGVADPGVDDDFFALGGHSLLATQVVARAREAFGDGLPLRAIFESPTIAGLAAAITGAGAGDGAGAVPLVARRRDPQERLPLSIAQEQMLGLELAASPPGLFNVTAIHRFTGPVDSTALEQALRYMVDRHETLRTAFGTEGGRSWQAVAPTAAVDLVESDLRGLGEEERHDERRRLVATQDAAPFDLSTPPVWRAGLLRLDDRESDLVVTFDHLICDMTSAYVFLGEVASAYRALIDGRAPDLPPPGIQYADFALWQREWLTEDRLASQLGYWRTALAGAPLGPALPFDHLPASPGRRIARRAVDVAPELYAPVRDLARATGATPFVVLVAAVSAVLGEQGGTTDVVLSTTLSGRARNELEGTIGMFAGIGRIRTDLSGDPPFDRLVGRARDAVLGLFEHQDVPFMKVRRAVFPDFPEAGDHARAAAVIPVELLYFHAAHDHWAPGSGVVERPGSHGPVDELYFRGQLQPLSLTFVDDGSRMWGHVSYKLDFYDDSTIERLAAGLEALLAELGTDPSRRLSDLLPGPRPVDR